MDRFLDLTAAAVAVGAQVPGATEAAGIASGP
jgi:hypothetical protein